MTETEAALQAAIDANPLTGLRMILADHLDEIGDVRADGYRVLDLLGRWPTKWANEDFGYYIHSSINYPKYGYRRRHHLPGHYEIPGRGSRSWFVNGRSRKEADDEAARLWTELPEESRRAVMAMVKAG